MCFKKAYHTGPVRGQGSEKHSLALDWHIRQMHHIMEWRFFRRVKIPGLSIYHNSPRTDSWGVGVNVRKISGLQSSTDVILVKKIGVNSSLYFNTQMVALATSGRAKENSVDNHIIKGFTHNYLVSSSMPNLVLADSGLVGCGLFCWCPNQLHRNVFMLIFTMPLHLKKTLCN